ncbi:MAG: protein TolA [Candidatus Muproteobacteria bacterium RBG_16_65_34]|uniref:Protein TolA n=1 Tax=Candidatus Muproteobacteria bacterium RBG_16_65_34 TaxID=1817760 RepID=A0A1F6TV79_9PROT|nr:MAG: protein TolA [Candidatus Muproteobacteria bacterium RBG_16_65_34]
MVYAVLLHAAVIALLVAGWRWTAQDRPASDRIMQAVVVVEQPPRQENTEPEARKAAQERSRAEQAEAENKRRVEFKKKQEEERRLKAEAARKKGAAEAEKKRKAEAEKKTTAQQRRKQAEAALQEQLAAEERARGEEARRARADAAAVQYKTVIRQKVSRNWNRPVTAGKGMECMVRVRLAPGGEVLEARVVRSCGDAAIDRSVESAVYKASPLPIPEGEELFEYFREIEFVFQPEE